MPIMGSKGIQLNFTDKIICFDRRGVMDDMNKSTTNKCQDGNSRWETTPFL